MISFMRFAFMPNLATKDPIGLKHIQPDPPVVDIYLANAGGGARRLTRPERVLAGRGNRISCSAVAAFFICSLILLVSLWVVTVASGSPGPSLLAGGAGWLPSAFVFCIFGAVIGASVNGRSNAP